MYNETNFSVAFWLELMPTNTEAKSPKIEIINPSYLEVNTTFSF